MLSARPSRPAVLRVADVLERSKNSLGRGGRLTFDQVHHIARQATGLDDVGDQHYEEPLRVLLESARSDRMTPLGRRVINDMAWSGVAHRMNMADHVRRHPDLDATPLRRPFLVMGMPRTGTTLMHRLLALDPQFEGPPLWQLRRPFPPTGDVSDDRRETAWTEYRATRKYGISYDHIHYVDPDTPDECALLKLAQLVSILFWARAPVRGFAEWTLERGNDDDDWVYREYRRFLLLLQAQHPGKALALKSPDHTSSLAAIRRIVPEAMVVNTVREPIEWTNSGHSLVYQLHALTSRPVDVAGLAHLNLRMQEDAVRQHLTARQASQHGVIDVKYTHLTERPLETLRSIYEFHEVDWPDGHDVIVKEYLHAWPQGKHGTHRYSGADFGVTDAEVSQRFADYIDVFGLRD
jgi:hypothetical protein